MYIQDSGRVVDTCIQYSASDECQTCYFGIWHAIKFFPVKNFKIVKIVVKTFSQKVLQV